MPSAHTTDANDNLRHAFRLLANESPTGASRRVGPLTAASTGVSVPLFNRVFALDAVPIDDLTAAVAWLAEHDVPLWVTATDSTLERLRTHRTDLALALDVDLAKVAEHPGMAMAPLDAIPAPDSVAEIGVVTDPDEREVFDRVTASVFGLTLDDVTRVNKAALAADDARLFLGRVNDTPVASGLLIRHGHVAGVYWIGVLEGFRRRGIGRAMTQAVLRAGHDAGCRVGVLQSSEMGRPLYERLGFETVVTYHHFEPID